MGEGIRVGPVVTAAALVYGVVVGFAAAVGVEIMRFAGASVEALHETSIELERAVDEDPHGFAASDELHRSPVASLQSVELDPIDLETAAYTVPPAIWPGNAAALIEAQADHAAN